MEDIFRRPPEGSIPKKGKTGGEAIPAGARRNTILDRIFRISTSPRFGWGGNKQDPVKRGNILILKRIELSSKTISQVHSVTTFPIYNF
jgi:hypothetical protein